MEERFRFGWCLALSCRPQQGTGSHLRLFWGAGSVPVLQRAQEEQSREGELQERDLLLHQQVVSVLPGDPT